MKNLYIILLLVVSLNVYGDQSEKLDNLAKPVFELIEKGKYKNIALIGVHCFFIGVCVVSSINCCGIFIRNLLIIY